MLSEGNYLWHLFSWELVPCLSGEAARAALAEASSGAEVYLFYSEYPPEGAPPVQPLTGALLASLPTDAGAIPGSDWYLVDRDFTWTYANTHEESCCPYFRRISTE